MKNILLFLFVLITASSFAQNATISGVVQDGSGNPVSTEIRLYPANKVTNSDTDGTYYFEGLNAGEYVIQFGQADVNSTAVTLAANEQKVMPVFNYDSYLENEELNTLTDLNALEGGDESTSVSSLLTASRDVFLNKAGFQFGSDVYFRVRGYDSKYTDFMLNGIRFENPETGWQPFSLVGGLNDVLRYRDVETIGSNSLDNGFGEIGGAKDYVLRPLQTGKGGRITYSNLNRSYNHRVMGTYASGDRNGIAYVVSGSKRWANEGYVDGTYYDAYAGYAAVEGKVSDNYSVMISALASPRRRGTQSIHTKEAYELNGSNYYNADWGYQNGEKRNSRLRKNYNPVLMVGNYIDLSPSTTLELKGSYMLGHNIGTRIERQNANNPDPDYYRNLPSNGGAMFKLSQQIDWVNFYRANTTMTPEEVNNTPYSGNRSNYILENNVRDDREYQVVAQFDTKVNDAFKLHYGANYRHYNGNYFKTVNDLLGGDYWLDVDFDGDKNNLAATDTRIYTDDKFGHDYDLNKRTYDGYLQGNYSTEKVDFFFGGTVGKTDFWREGYQEKAKFEGSSLGKSEVNDFLTYGGKAGATYKIDGRNYVSASGMYYTTPPNLNTVFLTPESNNRFNEKITEETVYGGEVSYNHKSPKLKARLTGYTTRFDGQAESLLAYFQANGNRGFGRLNTTGIDKLHYGGELGFDYVVTPELSVSGAGALGKYTVMSRPLFEGYNDTQLNAFLPTNSVYLLNFYEDNTPMTAANLGLTYRAPHNIILNVDGNYYNNSYAGASPLRRILPIAKQLMLKDREGNTLTQEEALSYWTKQEKLPSATRLNLSLYKEFRFSYDKRLGVNASLNNVLNDTNYPNLAFENVRTGTNAQNRIDPEIHPTRYRYAPGRTYFINLAYKFR